MAFVIHGPSSIGIARMVFEAALFLILISVVTVLIVKAYEWLLDFLYGPYINPGK